MPSVSGWRTGTRVTAAVSFSTVLNVLPLFLVAAQSVQIRGDLGFGEAALGVAIAGFFLFGAVGSVPGGRVAESIGSSRSLRLAAVGSALALLTLAFAPTWGWLFVGMSVGGACHGIAQPATSLALASSVSVARQGAAFGVKHAAVPVATILAGLALPAVALTLGWRWSFAMAILLAGVVVVLTPPGSSPARPAHQERQAPDLPKRPLVLLALGGGFAAASANSATSFLVESAVAAGTSAATAGFLLSAGGLTSVAVRLGIGLRADRRGRGHLATTAVMIAMGGAGYALLALAHASAVGLPVLALGTVLGLGAGWGWPGLFTFAIVRWNERAPAQATGFTQTGVFIGAVMGPLLFGITVSQIGYGVAWLGATGIAATSVAILVCARRLLMERARPGPSETQPAAPLADGGPS